MSLVGIDVTLPQFLANSDTSMSALVLVPPKAPMTSALITGRRVDSAQLIFQSH